MNTLDVIHAWKDEEYRLNLSASERAQLPEHPAGVIELPDPDLERVAGGETVYLWTVGCCKPVNSYFFYCTQKVFTVACCNQDFR